ncbi:hypothetical protein [Comamonas sp. CMM02]|uniref:hypothetical protein n=1 Tax=Comamonas sp. CMM02 TaxID=2769307 RepID=UPI0017861EBB|nr:hypothetical protein [Comamonas sp. CMM02]MBD9401344.1 hypothetical protein [Comamonas sp. CMM02]
MPTSFRDPLVKAMKRACEDMLRFSGEPAKRLNAEYLFTVAVAKEIDGLNGYYGDPYRIHLEKKTREFAQDCLLPVKFGNPLRKGNTSIRNGTPKISRNGRIDISVYEDISNNGYLGHQPICAIELKAFNPARALVLEDLKRNLEYFSIKGNTGSSVLGSTLFGALHAWPKVGTESEEEIKAENLRSTYVNWLSELTQTPEIRKTVSVHRISQDLMGEVIDNGEYQEINADTIHNFVGVVVEFCASGI